jgi:hypothetical protein
VHSCHEHQLWTCAPAGWPRQMPSRKSRLRAPIQVPAGVVAARVTVGARTMADVAIGWFAGGDWGAQKHQACVLDAAGKVVGERAFPHGGAGLAALCGWLASMAGDDPGAVAVAIEVPHGPGRWWMRCWTAASPCTRSTPSSSTACAIASASPAGAKDDRRDARVAAAGLRTDRHLFRPVAVSDPAVVELREWSRLAEALQRAGTRAPGQPRPPAALALLPAAAGAGRRRRGRVGPDAVDDGADPGQGGPPARGDAGAAAPAAPHPQGRCRDRPRHPPPACDQRGRGRHRSGRPAPPFPHRPAGCAWPTASSTRPSASSLRSAPPWASRPPPRRAAGRATWPS